MPSSSEQKKQLLFPEKGKLVQEFLEQRSIAYKILEISSSCQSMSDVARELNISPKQVIRGALIKDKFINFLLITSANRMIDYCDIARQLGPDYYVVEQAEDDLHEYFNTKLNTYLPIPDLLNIQCAYDLDIDQDMPVYLPVYDTLGVVMISGVELQNLLNAHLALTFTKEVPKLSSLNQISLLKPKEIKGDQAFGQTLLRNVADISEENASADLELPLWSKQIQALHDLYLTKKHDVDKLVNVIESDPKIVSQILCFAQTYYFKISNHIKTIDEAIKHGLDYEFVIEFALSFLFFVGFKRVNQGLFCTRKLWMHGKMCALLMARLRLLMPESIRPHLGSIYLSGLLHNIGLLYLGHAYPQHYCYLNRMMVMNIGIHINHQEKLLFSTSHQQVGAWVLKTCQFPNEVINSALYHHDQIDSVQYVHVKLVALANQLLAKFEMSDDIWQDNLYCALLHSLMLNGEEVQKMFSEVWSSRCDIQALLTIG